MEEKLKDYFKRYPNSQEVYENGGLLFHNRGAADSFGKSETKPYTRKQVDAIDAKSDKQDKVDEALKLAAINKLKETGDLSTLSYQEQLNLIKTLGLEIADKKGETILTALSEYKATLKDE